MYHNASVLAWLSCKALLAGELKRRWQPVLAFGWEEHKYFGNGGDAGAVP